MCVALFDHHNTPLLHHNSPQCTADLLNLRSTHHRVTIALQNLEATSQSTFAVPKLFFFRSRAGQTTMAMQYSSPGQWGRAESSMLATDMSWGPNTITLHGVTSLMLLICMICTAKRSSVSSLPTTTFPTQPSVHYNTTEHSQSTQML